MYNQISGHYAIADRFGSITESHLKAISQIKKHLPENQKSYKVLDFGVGNGAFLEKLSHFMPNAVLTGIDISHEMLALAKKNLPSLMGIEASATDATKYLPEHSQDLVLAHFINAYIPVQKLFRQANALARANGYFSLITTTYESFPVAQKYLAEFIAEGSLVSTVVGHYYKALVANTTVASGFSELKDNFKSHQFEILEHARIELPVVFKDINELALFGIEGTWFLNSISIRMLPKNFLVARLKRLFSKIFTFPYEDTHIIDVILARK